MPSSHAMVSHPLHNLYTLTGSEGKHTKLRYIVECLQSLFYMTSFVIAVLSRGIPSWWPLGFGPTVATLLAYVLTAR